MPENEPQIIIPEGAPLMPEFFPDLMAQPPIMDDPVGTVPNWTTVVAIAVGVNSLR